LVFNELYCIIDDLTFNMNSYIIVNLDFDIDTWDLWIYISIFGLKHGFIF